MLGSISRFASAQLGQRNQDSRSPWRAGKGGAPWGRALEVALYSAACGSIGHVLVRHPRMIRGVYRKLLTRFFDTDERHDFSRGAALWGDGRGSCQA